MSENKKTKKLIRAVFFVLFVFLIGIFSSLIFEGYLLPKISLSPTFSKYGIFKKFSESVTIVNKTEQIVVSEENSVNKIASQASASIVNIISIPNNKSKLNVNLPSAAKNGTGVILTSDGLIATYRSAIIENDASYKIALFNGSSFEASLIGVDEFTNLAFFKIDTSNLSIISFANSDDFVSGKKLIAIGASFEKYQNRYSEGILSYINKTFNISGKTLSSSEKLEGVFEADIAFPKDYLGGIIIDYNGELAGIIGSVVIDNQEKFFQITSNVIKNSMEFAIKNELGNRPYLGIYYLPITQTYAIKNNLNRDQGAIIFSPSGKQGLAIISGSPAEKAGLKINDIIIALDGKEINLDNPLSDLLNRHKKGDQLEFTVIRNEQEIKVPVKL
ncbi:MAG: S1C family serine protease [bacterium]|nr:S1C family serine protease [bacterium]